MAELKRGGLSVTPQQAEVVDYLQQHGICVVGAGAGSGKTHTTVAAVLDIIQKNLASVDQFILITFTNKAADELRARLEEEILRRVQATRGTQEYRLWYTQQERLAAAFVGTIHGFCAQVIRTFGYGERIAHESDITFSQNKLNDAIFDVVELYASNESARLLHEKIAWQQYDLRDLIRRILEHLQNRNLDPAEILNQTRAQPDDNGKPYRVDVADLVYKAAELYRIRKYEDQKLDASDLLSLTASLLSGNNKLSIIEQLKKRYQYLFIDEFQDTDRTQKLILETLRPDLAGLLIVGDRKQSIYSFRAADVSLMDQIAKENKVKILPLSISRRPTQELLALQNALFKSISSTYPGLDEPLEHWGSKLNSHSALAPMTYASASRNDLNGRITATAKNIGMLLTQQLDDVTTGELRPIEQRDIVILVRSNYQLERYGRLLNEQLKGTGINVRSDAGGTFFEQPEIVSIFHILRLILHYPDDTILLMALQTPYLRKVSSISREQDILQYGSREGYPLTDWFENEYQDYKTKLEVLRKAVRSDMVPQLLAQIYRSFDIYNYYLSKGNKRAINNLEKLRELARNLYRNEQALTLQQFIYYLQRSFISGAQEEEAIEDASETQVNCVRIMTIHRSKGLEFPIVIIPEVQSPLNRTITDENLNFLVTDWGLEVSLKKWGLDTYSPQFSCEKQRNYEAILEEEMRIFYVAVTRAKNSVVFIGSDPQKKPNSPDSEYYSWKDEIQVAWKKLESLGAVYRKMQN